MTRRNYPDRVLIPNSGDDITDDLANALTTIPTWTFGEPRLRASLNGQATWSRWNYQMGNTGWFTNIDFEKRHENLQFYKKYTLENYPKYDNYDAIEVSKISEIPMDYDGVIGVPFTAQAISYYPTLLVYQL